MIAEKKQLIVVIIKKQIKLLHFVTNTVAFANDPNQNIEIAENVVHVAPPPAGYFDPCRCCCCCCRKQILVMRKEQKVVKKKTTGTQRVITMNIEFSKYSNLNTPTPRGKQRTSRLQDFKDF